MEIGFIYAVGAAIIWGLIYAIDEKILSNTNVLTLLFVDTILAAIFILPIIFFIKIDSLKTLFSSGKMNLSLIFLTVLLAIIANFFIFSGIKNLNANLASIIEIAYPFFVVLFSYFLFKTTPNIYFFIGGALIFIGSFIIIKFA